MKTAGGILAFALATLVALPNAQARPRLGPGLLLAPLAIVGGIAGAAVGSRKARAHRAYQQRLRRERAAIRKTRPAKSQPVEARPAEPAPSIASRPAAAAASVGAAAGAWAGPLFWPHAYDDVFGYALARPADTAADTTAGSAVWSRGFGDAVAGLFAEGGVRRTALSERGMEPAWDNLCGSETPNAARVTVARIRDTVKPTAAQQSSLDELGDALTRAAERIEAACPARRAASATERLHLMIARLTAMRQAVLTVQARLRNFYEQLDDTQKAALDGVTAEPAQQKPAQPKPADENAAANADCAEPADLPRRQLERALRLTPAQRGEFERFYRTAMGLDRFVATTCPDREAPPRTAPERLEAIKDRLGVLRYAATTLSPAYERLERSLSDTQKSRLGALDRTAETAR